MWQKSPWGLALSASQSHLKQAPLAPSTSNTERLAIRRDSVLAVPSR